MNESTATAERPRLSNFALVGLLMGLAAPFTLVTGPFALYFGYRGLYAVNASNGRLRGRSAALAGIVVGGVTTLVGAVGIFALLMATVRTADARIQCENNMRVIGGATYMYHDNHDKIFPRAVVPLDGVPPEQRASWLAVVLPYLDPKASRETKWDALAGRLDLNKPWDDPANREALTFHVPYYQCPGAPNFDPHMFPSLTTYVGVAGVGDDAASLPKGDPRAGFFGYYRDVSAGSSYKMMLLETTQHNGEWIAGGPPTVRGVGFDPTFLNWEGATLFGLLAAPQNDFGAPVGGVLLMPRPEGPALIGPERPFGGCHQGGLNVLWADGSVRFVADTFPSHTFRMQASLSEDAGALANLP